jgi:THO complex subunit 2
MSFPRSLTFLLLFSYKQNKFNLLREQSEGYTKLSTELIQSIGAPHSSSTALPTESSTIIEARARAAWEKIVGLIGYFDLDPSRALDIILDVLTTHITTHYSFFLAILRASTWHRTQLHETNASSMDVDEKSSRYKGKTLDEVLTIAEGERFSKPRNASKAQVCAEVLGFKFVHYQVCVYTCQFISILTMV